MGTHEGNKKGSHVASDSMSEYSLSFAGLVCIHDQQQPKPRVPNRDKYIRVSKTDLDFEFVTNNKAELNNYAATPINITPAYVLISNGQIKAQQEVAQFPPNSPSSLSTLLGIGDHSNMLNEHTDSARRHHEQVIQGRNHANKERILTRSSFGKKVCKSFLAPCRECKAIQPSAVKGGQTTVPGEKSKLLT